MGYKRGIFYRVYYPRGIETVVNVESFSESIGYLKGIADSFERHKCLWDTRESLLMVLDTLE